MLNDFKQCIADAQEVIADITSPEIKMEAFKIVLSKLIDSRLKISLPSSSADNQLAVEQGSTNGVLVENEDELPVISPADGTGSNIRLLFSTEWGKKRRTVSEISKALDANGVPDPKHISTALGRLVESKELLRIKQNGSFVYWKNPASTS